MVRTLIFIIFLNLSTSLMLARIYNPCQPQFNINNIFDQRIKTVQLYKEGWNFSYPVIRLNSDERLIFQFDLVDNQAETYYYTFVHCDKDWNRSDIFTSEYLEGFPDNPLEDMKPSFNTTVRYFHYTLSFPNERISFLLSGNYILRIYPYGEPDNPVITQRFIITEDRVKIDFRAYRPQITAYNNTGQQFDFTVNLNNVRIIDPLRNIYCSVLQNGRWDNARMKLRPGFI